jgi:DNA-binding XRE family transcriptional regulator
MTGGLKMKNYDEAELKKAGARIRSARKNLSLTQAKASEKVFITSQYWSLLESGRMRASMDTYRRIADLLGLTLDDIFYDDAVKIRLHKTFSKEEMLAGCTESEKAIISETVFFLKSILERNRKS